MTLEQFLAREATQPLRYEFDGWQPTARTGATDQHEAIGGTLRAPAARTAARQAVPRAGADP